MEKRKEIEAIEINYTELKKVKRSQIKRSSNVLIKKKTTMNIKAGC